MVALFPRSREWASAESREASRCARTAISSVFQAASQSRSQRLLPVLALMGSPHASLQQAHTEDRTHTAFLQIQQFARTDHYDYLGRVSPPAAVDDRYPSTRAPRRTSRIVRFREALSPLPVSRIGIRRRAVFESNQHPRRTRTSGTASVFSEALSAARRAALEASWSAASERYPGMSVLARP